MKFRIRSIYRFFPIQLFLLHFRKYQVLLLFWLVLWSTINGNFLKIFGADSLLLAPEYLGNVNMLGAFITGIALGIFIMSWNITTFILQSKRFKFLATTKKPFLKYCINNSLIPLLFLAFYFIKLFRFNYQIELMPVWQVIGILFGVLGGFITLCIISMVYFFGAEIRINKTIAPLIADPVLLKAHEDADAVEERFGLKVNTFLDASLKIKKPRIVRHYRPEYIDMVFKRHHLAAIISIVLAFFFLVIIGFFLELPLFELPAAASVLIFFAILCAVIGSLAYFLQSWSLPAAILLVICINILYEKEVIDPRNKAYGLNYQDKDQRPEYTRESLKQLCTPAQMESDRQNMLRVLENWKARQSAEKPLMVFINVSGGGLRSAAFVMNTLQNVDSLSGGRLMKKTFLISGASGGMLAATYYRELYRRKLYNDNIDLSNKKYSENITRDLLNPVFTSMITRDVFAPSQKFSVGDYEYTKDRGYAFEKKLGDNTNGLLNIQMKDLVRDESSGRIPLIIFNAVIKRDGRKVVTNTQPMSFMMKPFIYRNDTAVVPDAVDFMAMFSRQDPKNLRLLTALRMNATFPYVLPNVWLPSYPVIDVMDAGLRDNFGMETSLRFLQNFEDWIRENTSGVVILQIRDRLIDNWHNPFETNSLTDALVNPATMLQHNWHKLQDYFLTDQFNYFKGTDSFFTKVNVTYMTEDPHKSAALNFHLSGRERKDVINSYYHPHNQEAIKHLLDMLKN